MSRPQRLAALRAKWAVMDTSRGGGVHKQQLRAADSVAELDAAICEFLDRFDWGARYPGITRANEAEVMALYEAIRADLVELDGGVQ